MRNLRDFGLYITFKKSVAYLLKPLFESHSRIIYRIELEDFPDIGDSGGDCEFGLVTPEDADLIHQIETLEEWLAGRLRAMLETDALCMAALQHGRVAAFYLASFGEGIVSKLHLVLQLGENEAFGEQITVHRDFRRQGLATRLRYFFFSHLKQMGVTSLYGHRALDNVASERSARIYRSQDLARMTYVRLLICKTLKCRPICGGTRQAGQGAGRLSMKPKPWMDAGRHLFSLQNKLYFSLPASELMERCTPRRPVP